MNDVLYIVVPCYNEEEVIASSIKVISDKLNELIHNRKISKNSKIVIVDDGSSDDTINIVKKLQVMNKFLVIIKLSRNFGHQFAMYAGLMETRKNADMFITMDADLQDDINAIDEMIEEYYKGNEIVYGVRNNRDGDNWFKRNSALLFYNIMTLLGGEIISNHADFRLMSRKSLDELSRFEESNLFIRGIIPRLGFQTSKVYYKRLERQAGCSKYNLSKMLGLAIDGITSFSVKPIRFIIGIGIIFSFLSFLYLVYIIISFYAGADVVNGWTSIIAFICFFGSFQILCIGVVGEYISKIYLETKRRPKYIVEEIIN